MSRARSVLVILVLSAALILIDSRFPDYLRRPMELVLSWPVRSLAAMIGAGGEPGFAVPAAERALWAEFIDRPDGDPEGATVLRLDWERARMILAAGAADGLQSGDVVASGDRFLGFVEAVSEHLCRVRLAHHPSCAFGGRLPAPPGDPLAPSLLLLKGEGDGLVAAAAGCRIEAGHLGRTVLLAGSKVDRELRVGVVVHDPARKEHLIRLEALEASLLAVRIHSQADGRPLPPASRSAFAPVAATVVLEADRSIFRPSFAIDAGLGEGIGLGDCVMAAGRLLGRVRSTGPGASRVVPIEGPSRFGLVALGRSEDGRLTARFGTEATLGARVGESLFTIGSSTGEPLPAGLLVSAVGDEGKGEGRGRPRRGANVIVQVFRFDAELRALDPAAGGGR